MGERTYEQISNLPAGITPLSGDELAELEQDGVSRKFSMSALGGVPSAHAASHKFGGSDVVGTQDKTANAIPITDGAGTLDVFVSDASTTVKGKVQLATDGESAANKAVQSNDARLSNSRTPTAHAASHLGGSDTLGLGNSAFATIDSRSGVAGIDSVGNIRSPGWPAEGTRFFSGYSYADDADVFNVYSDGRIEIGTISFAPFNEPKNATISVRENRTVLNWHAFEDYSHLTPTVDYNGYSSFDSKPHLFASANHLNSYQSRPIVDGDADVTIMTCFGAMVDHPGTGQINQIYNIRISEQTGDGLVLEQFGLYIGELTKGAVSNFAIYSEGGDSYHKGKFGIGARPVDGWNLYVKQNGATGSYGNIQSIRDQEGTDDIAYGIQSMFSITSQDDATKVSIDGSMIANNAIGTIKETRCFNSSTYCQSAEGRILNAKGFYSSVTGELGSSVDKYYGFFQDSLFSNVSVGEAYGFYSNLSNGTTKYNFYSAGTAPNYFAGFTALGSDSPYIKTKEISGTTALIEGGSVTIAHGLDMNKILSVSVGVLSGDWLIFSEYQGGAGYRFHNSVDSTYIYVDNDTTSSENILGRPIKILIIYKA